MLISLKLKIDAATDSFRLEFENAATPAKSYPIAHFGPGLGRTVVLNCAEDGTVTSLSIPGASEILAEMGADVEREKAEHAARVAAAAAPAPKPAPPKQPPLRR